MNSFSSDGTGPYLGENLAEAAGERDAARERGEEETNIIGLSVRSFLHHHTATTESRPEPRQDRKMCFQSVSNPRDMPGAIIFRATSESHLAKCLRNLNGQRRTANSRCERSAGEEGGGGASSVAPASSARARVGCEAVPGGGG